MSHNMIIIGLTNEGDEDLLRNCHHTASSHVIKAVILTTSPQGITPIYPQKANKGKLFGSLLMPPLFESTIGPKSLQVFEW